MDGESVVIYIISTAVPQSAQKDIPGHHALLVQQGQQQPTPAQKKNYRSGKKSTSKGIKA